MTIKSRSITLSVSPEEKAALEAIALQFGQTRGEKRPNVSRLMQAIANGQLIVAYSDETPTEIASRIKNAQVRQAVGAIKDGFDRLEKLFLGN